MKLKGHDILLCMRNWLWACLPCCLLLVQITLKASPNLPPPVDSNHLEDSLLTEDAVYEYTFTDFDKARRIMGRLRADRLLPSFELDKVEGDLYFNTGHYYQALVYYRNALANDSVRLVPDRYMEQLHRMISCYDYLHNDEQKAHYVRLLLKEAEAEGNQAMRSVALFNMGKMIYYQGQKEEGYDMMLQAIDLMEQTDYKYKYDNLRYNYNTLLVFYNMDRRPQEALEISNKLERILTAQEEGVAEMQGLNAREEKSLCAHRAVIYHDLGREEEARQQYERFLVLREKYGRDDYLIWPYLFAIKKYDEIIRMNTEREARMKAEGDIVNYHMTTIKQSLAKAYEQKGDYRRAATYFKQLAVLRDSIKVREQQSAALELAAIYDSNQKDLQLHEQEAEIQRHGIFLIFLLSASVLLGFLLWGAVRYNRLISFKNRAMANTINDLLVYKEDLEQKREENLALREELEALKKVEAIPEKVSEEKAEPEVESVENKLDRLMFDRLVRAITDRKLFLQANISREELINLVHIPKNKFASLFRQYAGTTFPIYMNNLRLMHAAELLKNQPNYTITAVAAECGMKKSTFYRLFVNKFGMTPMDYRCKCNADNKKADEA